MAVSIDWSAKVINVGQVDMVLIQTVPSLIYQHDLDSFREELKALEGGEEGLPFLDTHRHNLPVSVGGAVLARVIEFINGYTIQYEETGTPYRVQTVGANSNISEVIDLGTGQVSVSTSNSAGLQDLNSLQAASYGGQVTVNTVTGFSGTTFPIGTRQTPVNNMVDAHAIAELRGIDTFHFMTNMTLTSEDYSDGHIFSGTNPSSVVLTIEPGANVQNCTFINLTVQGTFDSYNVLRECNILDISHNNGFMFQCALSGTITLGGGVQATIMSCYSGVAGGGVGQTPTLDMGGTGQSLVVRDFHGGIKLTNRTGTDPCSIDMSSGQVVVDSTVTAGDITLRGIVASVTDNSTGTANVIDATESNVSKESLALNRVSAYHTHVHVDTNGGSPGTVYPLGTAESPVDNIADAVFIASARNINIIKVEEDATITATDDVSGFTIQGSHTLKSEITVEAGAVTTFTHFENCNLTGTLNGDAVVRDCLIGDLAGFSGIMHQVSLEGTLTLRGNKPVHILDSFSAVAGGNTPTINLGGSGVALTIRNYNGGIKLENKTGTDAFSMDINSGQIILDSTITAGHLILRGHAKLTDNSNGTATVDSEYLIQTITAVAGDNIIMVPQEIDVVVEEPDPVEVLIDDEENIVVVPEQDGFEITVMEE